jgi:hypothetical protein
MITRQLFEILTQGLEADINRLNPWWRGLPQAPLPPVKRKSVYNAPFGIIVTLTDEPATDDPRIVSIPLSTLLMLR